MMLEPVDYLVASVIVTCIGLGVVFGMFIRRWLDTPPYDSAAEWRKLQKTCADGIAMLQEQQRQHARWQRNYEAGRYWGDDGDGESKH